MTITTRSYTNEWTSTPRHQKLIGLVSLTSKTLTAMPTHMMNVRGKFHWNPSTT